MKLLHIDSSILGNHSVSRRLSADIVARIKTTAADLHVTYRDLSEAPLPHLSGAYVAAARNPQSELSPEVRNDLELGSASLEEFLEADIIVIGAALYNFSIPSQLKSWLDRILVAGKTFRYAADGRPEGLTAGKRVIIGAARGSVYGPGSPIASYEHGESLLRVAFGFIGVRDIEVIVAEGVGAGPEQRQRALAAAKQQIAALAA